MFGREKEMDLGQLSARSGRLDPVPGTGVADAPRGPYEPGRLALGIFTLLVLAAGALMFVRVEDDAVHDPVKRAQRGEISTTDAASLTRPANMRRMLRAVDGKLGEGGFIDSLRVDPTSANVIVVQPDGRRQTLSVNVAFDVSSSDAGTGEGEGLQPSSIDATAPQKIIRAAQRRLDLQPRNFDYMVISRRLSESSPPPSWSAFWTLPLKDNDVAAAADGTDVRPLGTPDAASRARTKAAAEQAERSRREAEARAACLRKADTADEIQRCVQ